RGDRGMGCPRAADGRRAHRGRHGPAVAGTGSRGRPLRESGRGEAGDRGIQREEREGEAGRKLERLWRMVEGGGGKSSNLHHPPRSSTHLHNLLSYFPYTPIPYQHGLVWQFAMITFTR